MFKINNYKGPSDRDLLKLRSRLGLTEEDLNGRIMFNKPGAYNVFNSVSKSSSISFKSCFFLAAGLTLSSEQLSHIYSNMLEIGAKFEFKEYEH